MPLKLLLISHRFHPFIGGIEVHSGILARVFAERGFEVRVLTWTTTDRKDQFPFRIIRNPGPVQLIRLHAWADIVFENNPCIRLAWPKRLFNKRSVIALHTWVQQTHGHTIFSDRVKKIWIGMANKVIACSKAIQQKTFAAAEVIPNPYDDGLFRILPGVSRTKSFVFLGRLVSDKGADMAIHALHALVRDETVSNRHALQLTIIGEGPERESLEKLVSGLQLQNQVQFTGSLQQEALIRCLNEHQLILIPSRWEEPFGMVALEGMACGCIPVVSDGGGLPEAIGKAGLTFTRNDQTALIRTLKQLLGDVESQNTLRANAVDHLKEHTLHKISARYLQAVESVLKQNTA